MPRPRLAAAAAAVWLLIFAVAALLNTGGYRFGVSDQAFYVPAVARHANPSLFPRDWAMLGAQDQLNAFTPLAGWVVGTLGVPLPFLFALVYVVTLVVLGTAALAFGRGLAGNGQSSTWTAAAILLALSLKHAVALGAVNTLEGYAHPRMLAFAVGVFALAALLCGRRWTVVALVGLAAVVHPTTALWFAVAAGVGLAVAHKSWRPWVVAAGALLGVAAAWAIAAGPLAPRFTRMDAEWLGALASKRYLFPDRWPASEWALVGIYAAAIGLVHWHRWLAGLVSAAEAGLVLGIVTLLLVFGVAIPLDAARVALVVQLQVPRVLWIADLLAVAYAVWVLCEGGASPASSTADRPPTGRRPKVVALVILALALGRGAYVSFVEHAGRDLVQTNLPDTEWTRALTWIERHSAPDALVIADPTHAWRYGTSVRVGAKRDVLLEAVKDSAMALYSRETAARVVERAGALDGFEAMTAERARALGARYGASLLVIERDLALPLLHQESAFRVYALQLP